MTLQESRFVVLWEKLLEVSEVRIFLATFHYNALFSRRATIHDRNLKTIQDNHKSICVILLFFLYSLGT